MRCVGNCPHISEKICRLHKAHRTIGLQNRELNSPGSLVETEYRHACENIDKAAFARISFCLHRPAKKRKVYAYIFEFCG